MKDGSGGGKRSESDKEKTKMRERQRRAITTNIFHGLRKHGGYHLSSRADINEVLRELAKEAGWVVEPDGTTYRSKASNSCPLCGAVKTTSTTIANPMPTSSAVIGGGGGGECSTTASPRGAYVGDPLSNINVGSRSLICFPESFSGCHQPISVPVCTYQELSSDGGGRSGSGDAFLECSATAMGTTYEQQGQILHLEAPLRHF